MRINVACPECGCVADARIFRFFMLAVVSCPVCGTISFGRMRKVKNEGE